MPNATVEMYIDGFDEPFIIKRPNLPQMAILRETCTIDGNIDEPRLLAGAIALFVAHPAPMSLAEATKFCADHFDTAIKLFARISEMLD